MLNEGEFTVSIMETEIALPFSAGYNQEGDEPFYFFCFFFIIFAYTPGGINP